SCVAIHNFGQELIRYLATTVDCHGMPHWSADGKQIAFVRIHGLEERLPLLQVRSNPWGIYIADASSGEARAIWRSTEDMIGSLSYLTDYKYFHFIGYSIVFDSVNDISLN